MFCCNKWYEFEPMKINLIKQEKSYIQKSSKRILVFKYFCDVLYIYIYIYAFMILQNTINRDWGNIFHNKLFADLRYSLTSDY